jgi:hypothetical protein
MVAGLAFDGWQDGIVQCFEKAFDDQNPMSEDARRGALAVLNVLAFARSEDFLGVGEDQAMFMAAGVLWERVKDSESGTVTPV